MVMPSSIESDPSDPMIGHSLGGKYTLERLIGRGGMGHVYLAHVEEGGESKQVVVKMIAPPLAQQPQAMARFEREAKRLDGLRHSNVVEMYDYGRDEGRAYIVMEHVDGELLSDYMARKGRLTLAEYVPIAAQILKGVGHAHSRDLMIRDIKPANVMLCERKGRANFVKIIDFGLAKMLEGDEDITKQHFIGTSGYLSPEQIKGLDIDLRVDVYALGVLFYQMLSGRMPFEAENDTTLLYKHVHEFPTPLSEVLPADHEVPEELIHLIHDCLEKDPAQRPRDANEIVERIIDCVPMAMFKLPPVGQDVAPPSAGDTGSISALSTAALAAPSGETASYMRLQELAESGAATSQPTTGERPFGSGSHATLSAEPVSGGGNKMGMIIGGVVAAAAVIGILVFALGGKDDPAPDTKDDTAAVAADLESSVAEAERLVTAGDFAGAGKILDTVRGQVSAAPALAGRVESLDAKVKVGKLMLTAKKFDEEGKVEAAISAYESVLEADSANAEARERLTELRNTGKATAVVAISSEPAGNLSIDGSPTGTTPYDDALPIGKHTVKISADGYEVWEQEVEVKSADNLPIKVKLTAASDNSTKKKPAGAGTKPAGGGTKPAGGGTEPPPETKPEETKADSPFMSTKKKKSDGPFLPVEK
ncbi:MAG: serine/threonine protein kinase [Myxococcales bacterium]|nr:serine/threonine protein kinase [Myxococcales bacterium]